jgi:hypothetical protein
MIIGLESKIEIKSLTNKELANVEKEEEKFIEGLIIDGLKGVGLIKLKLNLT